MINKKLSKKYSASELINSSKTKKYSLLNNRKYIKNIQALIDTKNKRKQKGGASGARGGASGGAGTGTTAQYGKYEYGKFNLFNTKRAGRTGKHEVKDFNIYSKKQYFWIKRNIYNTIRGSWLLKKFGKIWMFIEFLGYPLSSRQST